MTWQLGSRFEGLGEFIFWPKPETMLPDLPSLKCVIQLKQQLQHSVWAGIHTEDSVKQERERQLCCTQTSLPGPTFHQNFYISNIQRAPGVVASFRLEEAGFLQIHNSKDPGKRSPK